MRWKISEKKSNVKSVKTTMTRSHLLKILFTIAALFVLTLCGCLEIKLLPEPNETIVFKLSF